MYAALLLPDFFLQARLRLMQNTSRPHALLDGEGRKAVIVTLNEAARTAGLEIGMAMPLALARCPDLVLVARSESAEREASALLRAAAWTLSPFVEDSSPGLVTAQLAGLPKDRREHLGQRAIEMLGQSGLHAQLGLADTPLTAAIAAHYAFPVLSIGNPTDFLDPLPLGALEPPKDLAHILSLWGIKSIGQFRAIPLADIVQRLGASGAALWHAAAGGSPRPLNLAVPPTEHIASHECEDPMETLAPLLFIARRLIDRLVAELDSRHLAAEAVVLNLRLEDDRHLNREFSLPEPTGNANTLFNILLSHLQTVRTDAPIVGLNLRLVPARPSTKQHGLFDAALRDPHGFNETIARVSAAIGTGKVGTPTQSPSHHPDSGELAPPAISVPPLGTDYQPPIIGLPLRRYRPPHPASITFVDTLPVHVSSLPVRGPVRERRGPWLGSSDWWRPESAWRREEWDVEIEGGGLYRLLRLGEDWFVEGEYD